MARAIALVALLLFAASPAIADSQSELIRHRKLADVYQTISSTSLVYSRDEVDSFGEKALALSGDDRIYALWRVLYAYKIDQNDAKLAAWSAKIKAVAHSQRDSNLDMLARFMPQAYDNEANVYKNMSADDWAGYLAVSDKAIHNIVLLERQRQVQFRKEWAQAIDIGEDLIVRLQTEGPAAQGLLAIAHQTMAYNMLRVGDLNSYADRMQAAASVSKGNAFFLQTMDMVYDLSYFAAENHDVSLAREFQQLHSKYVRQYGVESLKSWDQELCAFVAYKAEAYEEVVRCLDDSPVAAGIIKNGHDAYKLRFLTLAYARLNNVGKARYYLNLLDNTPDTLIPPSPLIHDEAEAYIAAGQGKHVEAFQRFGDLVTETKRIDDDKRIGAIQDMYKTLRTELDRKTAEAKLLNQQVQLRNWLLGTAVAIVLLLVAIAAGAALWVLRMRRMQWRLKEVSDHAEAANAAKSRFLAVMSHELRTPLNGVLGMAHALQREKLTDDQRSKVEMLAESGETLLMLLNDVLDMSRIEAGKVELSPTPSSMKDTIERVFNTFAPTISDKPVALRYDLDPSAAGTMSFDVLRVYQCLSNLVSNAVKFTNEGVIRVVASAEKHLDRPGYTVRIEVRDTGIGISKLSLSKLFEAYSQADASTARKYGGSGLGLSITRRLTELMGGSVSVTSEEGAGSVFVMTFEAGEVAPAAADAAEDTAPEDLLPHGIRILLVDDHPVNRKVARLFLEPFGFDITEAVDGQEALDAGMEDYDLVLMDVNMPRLGGIDATRQFRSAEEPGKHVSIIALTADALPEQIEACLAAGMDAHVSKPIVMDKLIDTVVSLLGEDVIQAAQSA
ncbi:ATP-binding protein [Asticcacaulis solisilvae]|uniref:ATP-binding protein n=1 Tax=Asticcacaulis solisilvae TaxID=1217274 RepID=UPI003FD70180